MSEGEEEEIEESDYNEVVIEKSSMELAVKVRLKSKDSMTKLMARAKILLQDAFEGEKDD